MPPLGILVFLEDPHLANATENVLQTLRRFVIHSHLAIQQLGMIKPKSEWILAEPTERHGHALTAARHLAEVSLGLTGYVSVRCGEGQRRDSTTERIP